MNTLYITNAFSLSMISNTISKNDNVIQPTIIKVSQSEIQALLYVNEFISGVGHIDTANILTNMLNVNIKMNRINISLDSTDRLIVAQYKGSRLPEGSTELPEGASFDFYLIYLE